MTPRIPDGQPTSRRTYYRRRAEAGLSQPNFRYPWDESVFSEWSDGMAWLIGLIWADGHLAANRVDICSKDRDLMETVAEFIRQPDGVRPKNGGRAWRVVFTSRRVADFLRSIGLTGAKSHTAPWPNVPVEFEAAFVRGLLDGDGTCQPRMTRAGQQVPDLRFEIVSAAPLLTSGLTAWLDRNGIAHGRRRDRNLWRVYVVKQSALRSLHGLLYPTPDVPTLARKRANFDKWMTTPRPRVGRPRKAAV